MNRYRVGDLSVTEFIENSLQITETRFESLGLSRDALLDPDDHFDRQVAILRHSYLLAERSAIMFKPGDENFWRVLRARIQPMILAYRTHEKFVRGLENDGAELKVREMMEVYRDRLATTEQFKDLFFHLRDQGVERRLVIETANQSGEASENLELQDRSHYDGSEGIADIQANVINELKESLKEQERVERQLKRQLKQQEEQLRYHEKTIEKLEAKKNELQDDNERLSTENLQLKIALDASQKVSGPVADASVERSVQPVDDTVSAAVDIESASPSRLTAENYADASKEELILKIESLERDLDNTSRAAYGAFMANSDLGIVVLFTLSAFKCNNVNRLAQEVGRSLKTYGMYSVFRVKSEASVDFFSEDSVTDKDKLLFKNHEGEGRFVDLGKNYLIYDEHTAVLVKNMPTDDEERLGRLKDNLNTLMQGAETSANLIKLSQSAEMQKQRMEALLIRSNAVFSKLASNLERNKQAAIANANKTASEIRTQMKIAPGSPANMKLSAALRQMEASLQPLFAIERLVDAAFMKNVARVVEGLKRDKK